MNLKDALNKMIKDNNTSHAGLAKKMNYRSAASIGNITSRGDAKASTLIKICDVLGYDIIIKPKYGDNKAERTILLDDMLESNDNRGKWRE